MTLDSTNGNHAADVQRAPTDTETQRAQAIASNALIKVEPHRARYTGWIWPAAITSRAWDDAVTWQPEDAQRHRGAIHDGPERLTRLLTHARCAAFHAPEGANRALFELPRIRRDGPPNQIGTANLVVRLDFGDHGQPLVTIMLEDEE